jgi:hypothetical protein
MAAGARAGATIRAQSHAKPPCFHRTGEEACGGLIQVSNARRITRSSGTWISKVSESSSRKSVTAPNELWAAVREYRHSGSRPIQRLSGACCRRAWRRRPRIGHRSDGSGQAEPGSNDKVRSCHPRRLQPLGEAVGGRCDGLPIAAAHSPSAPGGSRGAATIVLAAFWPSFPNWRTGYGTAGAARRLPSKSTRYSWRIQSIAAGELCWNIWTN